MSNATGPSQTGAVCHPHAWPTYLYANQLRVSTTCALLAAALLALVLLAEAVALLALALNDGVVGACVLEEYLIDSKRGGVCNR